MRATLANLQTEEDAIIAAYERGADAHYSMREHLNNIRKNGLFKAQGFKNFEAYVKGSKRLPMGYRQASQLAASGEVEGYLEKSSAPHFSERALTELSKLRVNRRDKETGEIKKTHQIDATKVKRVARSIKPVNGQVTAPMVKDAIEKVLGDKQPKPFGDQLEAEIKKHSRWLRSVKSLYEENESIFLDADQQCPGVATRLAKVHSEIASFLRKVQK